MTAFTIQTRSDEGVTHMVLAGEFDLAALPQFEDAIAAVEAGRPAAIVVDLSGLSFMDSSGLRALVTADERAHAAGRRLAIVPGPPPVRRVFEITQLDSKLDLVEDASAVSPG
ncbi:MAG: STAS domain-containing protein [Thermoleophilaceae bacterium]